MNLSYRLTETSFVTITHQLIADFGCKLLDIRAPLKFSGSIVNIISSISSSFVTDILRFISINVLVKFYLSHLATSQNIELPPSSNHLALNVATIA